MLSVVIASCGLVSYSCPVISSVFFPNICLLLPVYFSMRFRMCFILKTVCADFVWNYILYSLHSPFFFLKWWALVLEIFIEAFFYVHRSMWLFLNVRSECLFFFTKIFRCVFLWASMALHRSYTIYINEIKSFIVLISLRMFG